MANTLFSYMFEIKMNKFKNNLKHRKTVLMLLQVILLSSWVVLINYIWSNCGSIDTLDIPSDMFFISSLMTIVYSIIEQQIYYMMTYKYVYDTVFKNNDIPADEKYYKILFYVELSVESIEIHQILHIASYMAYILYNIIYSIFGYHRIISITMAVLNIIILMIIYIGMPNVKKYCKRYISKGNGVNNI